MPSPLPVFVQGRMAWFLSSWLPRCMRAAGFDKIIGSLGFGVFSLSMGGMRSSRCAWRLIEEVTCYACRNRSISFWIPLRMSGGLPAFADIVDA